MQEAVYFPYSSRSAFRSHFNVEFFCGQSERAMFVTTILFRSANGFKNKMNFAIPCMSQNLSQTLSEPEPSSLAVVIHTSQECICQAADAVIS